MPSPPRTLIAFRTSLSSSGGGGGDFGYAVITPSSGTATLDIAINGSGTSCFNFRLVLGSTSLNIPNPVWTGGTIVAGLKIWLYLFVDPTFNGVMPTFATGSSGSFGANVNLQQIVPDANTFTCLQFTYHGTRWLLDNAPVGTGMSTT